MDKCCFCHHQKNKQTETTYFYSRWRPLLKSLTGQNTKHNWPWKVHNHLLYLKKHLTGNITEQGMK